MAKNNALLALSLCIALFFASAGVCYEIDRPGIYPKIITPNNDGRNDIFFVRFSNPYDNELSAKIYTSAGAEVAVMALNEGESFFYWDGKDSNGVTVPAGLYIFQVSGEGSKFSGAVIVAR